MVIRPKSLATNIAVQGRSLLVYYLWIYLILGIHYPLVYHAFFNIISFRAVKSEPKSSCFLTFNETMRGINRRGLGYCGLTSTVRCNFERFLKLKFKFLVIVGMLRRKESCHSKAKTSFRLAILLFSNI